MNTDAMTDIIMRTIRKRGRAVDTTAESAIHDALNALVPTIARKERERVVRALSDHAVTMDNTRDWQTVLRCIDIVCGEAPNAAE